MVLPPGHAVLSPESKGKNPRQRMDLVLNNDWGPSLSMRRVGFHMPRVLFRCPLRGTPASTCLAIPGGAHACLFLFWGGGPLARLSRGS